jgi:hypothetical protein
MTARYATEIPSSARISCPASPFDPAPRRGAASAEVAQ